MLEEILGAMSQKSRSVKAKKLTRDFKTAEILSALNKNASLPIRNSFADHELVTQIVTYIDPADGEPMRNYGYPLPGQPAEVVCTIPDPKFTTSKEGNNSGYEDLLIRCAVPTRSDNGAIEIREYCVSSRFFRPWVDGEEVNAELAAYIDKAAAELE